MENEYEAARAAFLADTSDPAAKARWHAAQAELQENRKNERAQSVPAGVVVQAPAVAASAAITKVG